MQYFELRCVTIVTGIACVYYNIYHIYSFNLADVQNTLQIRWYSVVLALCNVVSTSGTDFVLTLRNVENPTSDFVLFSTPDQRYFNVWSTTLKQCWSKVEMLAG